MPSKEELETAHKKALKALEGEKRAAIKKAKALKGKKGKEVLSAAETDFADKQKALEAKYQEDIAALAIGSMTISDEKIGQDNNQNADDANETTPAAEPAAAAPDIDPEEVARQRKLAKARKKRKKQKAKELALEKQIEEETTNAGPSMRDIELGQLQSILSPLHLSVQEVQADGHCLYRALGAHTNQPFQQVRSICADALQQHSDEFSAFCELQPEKGVNDFDDYVNMVRNSAEWGGHLELRALGMALKRPIHIYSVQSGSEPLKIEESQPGEPILVSYHLHHYALGEHYNQVVKE